MSLAKKTRGHADWEADDADEAYAAGSDRRPPRLCGCGCADPAAPQVADCVRNPVEALALAVTRAHLALQVHGGYACLDAAHSLAEAQFEATVAADFVARVTLLLRSMRQERRTPFAFLPVHCRGITSDERDFLLALQAAEACDVTALGERAGQLAKGGLPIRTSLALGWLAALVVDASG